VNKRKYPITGIDISAHTGKIDFPKIANQNIDFVFIKATEGETFVDSRLEVNYTKAHASNIPFGFYHFYRFNRDGRRQANNFLKNIHGKKTALPLVIDVEEWGNVTRKNVKDIKKEINTFITVVEQKSGRPIIIYTNESSFEKYIRDNCDKKDIWICSFNKTPKIGRKWTFWQHSHKGRLEGADGWVDLNTFNGSRDEWTDYLKKVSLRNTRSIQKKSV
jgi:lysozyme